MMSARTLTLLSLVLLGCGDDQQQTVPDAPMPDSVDYSIGDPPALAMPCSDSITDLYTLPSDLPAMDDSHRGDVFRCAVTEKMTIPDIRAQIAADNMPYENTTDGTINSGFWTFRIAYRTQRNTVAATRAEGDTAAFLILPADPLPGNPLVVYGHGSTGVAPKCAPSRLDLSGAIADEDYPPILWRLAGYGFTVIAPDYNGYSFGEKVGYFNAEDEAHAMLDATRAAAKLLPSPPTKVVFVGHSQGGHAALAAQSYAASYGMEGELAGVATFAPLWNSLSVFAAATLGAVGLTTQNDVEAILYSMEYAYAASELREPGTGGDVFQVDKKEAAIAAFSSECYDAAALQALGETPADIFDSTYIADVGGNCAFSANCGSELATTWSDRWKEDRPAVDAMSAPMLMMLGGSDTYLPPARAACAVKKVEADLAAVTGATTTLQTCYDENVAHRDIVRSKNADYLIQWIAAKVGAGDDPGSCTPFPANINCTTIPADI